LLCSEAGLLASSLRSSDAVELLSTSTCTASLYAEPQDLTRLTTCASAVTSAYSEAKVSAAHVDVAEVHDCFTITELMMYEALQLCPPGSAAAMLRAHETDLNGRTPVNTGGGLVGFGHPVGATGVKQVVELWRQMKGNCGAYQMKKIPQIGVCANMGGEFECSWLLPTMFLFIIDIAHHHACSQAMIARQWYQCCVTACELPLKYSFTSLVKNGNTLRITAARFIHIEGGGPCSYPTALSHQSGYVGVL
jgi:hypothetical protein